MSKKNSFEEAMKQRTYAELINIVKKQRNDYQPEAVTAAEDELKKRDQTGEKYEAPEKKIVKKKLTAEEKAKKPLATIWKIATLILPGMLNLTMARELREDGYTKQSDDLWKWFFFGLLFWVGLLVLAFVLSQIFS